MPKEKFYRNGQMNFRAEWGACKHPEHAGRNCMGLLVEGGHIFEPGNSEHLEDLDRLIAALKRAKRAMLGTSTGIDGFVDYLPDAVKQGKVSAEDAARAKEQALKSPLNNGIVFVPDTGPAVMLDGRTSGSFTPDQWRAANGFSETEDSSQPLPIFDHIRETAHNPTDICPVPGCNCDLDYRSDPKTLIKDRKKVEQLLAERMFEAGSESAAGHAYVATNVFFEILEGLGES